MHHRFNCNVALSVLFNVFLPATHTQEITSTLKSSVLREVNPPTVIIMPATNFKCPDSVAFMNVSTTLQAAPVDAWFKNIISWCMEDYYRCVAFVRLVNPPSPDPNHLYYQPGLIAKYDSQTLRAWCFEASHDQVLCGTDFAYIPLSGCRTHSPLRTYNVSHTIF